MNDKRKVSAPSRETQNLKFEYRNPKQIRMTEIHNRKKRVPVMVFVPGIRILNFMLVSDFGFRISDLLRGSPFVIRHLSLQS
ncbi:MAG: hypothetical protein DME33_01910 [Verrucomicrobia bacterium]|nr:MAG: hypothetical protein DME33_01910 [Verrucomicrobiota bacterium]